MYNRLTTLHEAALPHQEKYHLSMPGIRKLFHLDVPLAEQDDAFRARLAEARSLNSQEADNLIASGIMSVVFHLHVPLAEQDDAFRARLAEAKSLTSQEASNLSRPGIRKLFHLDVPLAEQDDAFRARLAEAKSLNSQEAINLSSYEVHKCFNLDVPFSEKNSFYVERVQQARALRDDQVSEISGPTSAVYAQAKDLIESQRLRTLHGFNTVLSYMALRGKTAAADLHNQTSGPISEIKGYL